MLKGHRCKIFHLFLSPSFKIFVYNKLRYTGSVRVKCTLVVFVVITLSNIRKTIIKKFYTIHNT